MEFGGHVSVDDPAPPTADDLDFAVPIATFAEQPALEEFGVGAVGHGNTLVEVALSYTLWRHPDDRDDPANLAELTPDLQRSLDVLPPWPLPPWLLEARRRMRYPTLWEAVRTTRVDPRRRQEHETPEAVLVHHVNHILRNAFRDERVRGAHHGELLGAATKRAVEHGVPVTYGEASLVGLRLDTDAQVFGAGVDLGDRLVTAVVPRGHLPQLRLAFRDRPSRANLPPSPDRRPD
jgi:hypothetical protein